MTEPSGILLVHKHSGVTSHDIVWKVRKLFGTKRVGHTGTLDPMASGVLVVLVGRAAKAAEYLVSDEKRYSALLRLGLTTDTEDATGNVLTTSDTLPTSDEVMAAYGRFVGEIMQIPPMYSALKVGGQKLCDLARRGITVDRPARPITVYQLEAEGSGRDYTLEVACSAGTYIRTLCADIGNELGCGGAMSSLLRTETGGFSLDSAHTFEELEALGTDERYALLVPVEKLFEELPEITFPEFYERLALNGAEIYQKKIGTKFEADTLLRVFSKNGAFIGLAKVGEYQNGSAIKIVKFLNV